MQMLKEMKVSEHPGHLEKNESLATLLKS